MIVPPGFDHTKQELYFGFQMTTESLRYQEDPFTITVPVLVNCGKPIVKSEDDARS